MLDVHPPHHAPQGRRDFFIHIATIVVGLLIAAGLEQTVEVLHRHEQREELQRQFRAESQHNLGLIDGQLQNTAQTLRFLDRSRRAPESAKQTGSDFLITMPQNDIAPRDGMLISPSRATRAIARSAGIATTLPDELAKLYFRVDLAEFARRSASRKPHGTVVQANAAGRNWSR